MSKKTLTVLIPAINEEKTIKKIVTDSFKFSPYKTTVLVIIDSKTTDKTAEIAKQSGAKVLHVGRGFGKGYAFSKAVSKITSDYTLQIDADYQFLPREIKKITEPLENGYDITLGTRYQKGSHVEKEAVSPLKLLGSYFLSMATTIAVNQRITDVMAGFKGFKTSSLKKIKPSTHHFGYEAELVIKAHKKGLKICNVPISYKKRIVGNSNVNSLKHGLLVLQTIIQTRLHRNSSSR